MVILPYDPSLYIGSDFIGDIGPIGSLSFYFLSGAPKTKNSLTTLIRPFTPQVWGFLLASIVAVSIALIVVNKVQNTLSDDLMRETPFQSTWR